MLAWGTVDVVVGAGGGQAGSRTAKGFVFITMEDEGGLMNVIVRPDVYQQYYKVLRNCFLLIVEGTIQKQRGILNVLIGEAVQVTLLSVSRGRRCSTLTSGPGARRSPREPPRHAWFSCTSSARQIVRRSAQTFRVSGADRVLRPLAAAPPGR